VQRLIQLIEACKCSVHITVNQHRDYYESVDVYMSNRDDAEVAPEVLQKMIESDTVIQVQCYPRTPIGSFSVFHYDVKSAIEEAMAELSTLVG